jgi:uncharacterized protein
MDQETIKEVIVFLKQCLVKNGIQVDAIALFGSALHGDMNKESDIDLIIISSGFSNLDIFDRARLTMKSETETLRKFKIPMDILNLTPEEYEHSNARLFYQSKIVA